MHVNIKQVKSIIYIKLCINIHKNLSILCLKISDKEKDNTFIKNNLK